jgi:hypothetical protein
VLATFLEAGTRPATRVMLVKRVLSATLCVSVVAAATPADGAVIFQSQAPASASDYSGQGAQARAGRDVAYLDDVSRGRSSRRNNGAPQVPIASRAPKSTTASMLSLP